MWSNWVILVQMWTEEGMNYEAQMKLVKRAIERFPSLKERLLEFRRCWTLEAYKYETVIIGNHPISDHVILMIDLEYAH